MVTQITTKTDINITDVDWESKYNLKVFFMEKENLLKMTNQEARK